MLVGIERLAGPIGMRLASDFIEMGHAPCLQLAGHFQQHCRHHGRATIDQTGLELYQVGTSPDFLQSRNGIGHPADADQRHVWSDPLAGLGQNDGGFGKER